MTGKQLKNSILQWAIQGKLVPQDPNDEPASALLEKIRTEKVRLIKEGKIKKDKKESIIYRGEDNSYYEKFADGKVVCIADEIPFEIPNTWAWVRLSDVITLLSGRDLEPSHYNSDKKGIPYMTGASNFNDGCLIENRWTSFPQTISHKGDLLITCKGTIGTMAFNTIGDIHIARQIMAVSSTYINLKYLELYLKLYVSDLQRVAKSIIPGISRDDMLLGLCPLPPKEEQQRIVSKLKEVIPYVERFSETEDALSRLNSEIRVYLKKSILQEAIQGRLVAQDPNDEPASALLERIRAEKAKLVKEGKLKKKDLVESTIYRGDDNKYYEQIDGTVLQIEADYTFPDSWGVVRLAHICRLMDGEKKGGNYICLDAKYLRGKSSGDILPKGKFVSTGDNIILVDGENSGEVFAVPHDGYMGSTFKQLWVSGNMHLPYVLYFIQFYKDLLRNSKKGAAIPHLNKEIFYSLIVGIPPYQEQERIANAIGELYAWL